MHEGAAGSVGAAVGGSVAGSVGVSVAAGVEGFGSGSVANAEETVALVGSDVSEGSSVSEESGSDTVGAAVGGTVTSGGASEDSVLWGPVVWDCAARLFCSGSSVPPSRNAPARTAAITMPIRVAICHRLRD